MKGIVEMINEAASVDRKLTFNLQTDIYNVLADLCIEYDKKGKDLEEKDVRKMLDWFMDRFFVDPPED